LSFVERKFVIASWGPCQFPILFLVNRQDPKGKMNFEPNPDIPVIAGDSLAYGVACL
jgi:hypothetical protein